MPLAVNPSSYVLLVVTLGGCAYYDDTLLTHQSLDIRQAPPDAAADHVDFDSRQGVATVDGDSNTCRPARPPDPPAEAKQGGDIDFVVAVSFLDFGDTEGDTPHLYGYDLDGNCSCRAGAGHSCARPGWASAPACDGPDGRDNQAGQFIHDIAELAGGWGSKNLRRELMQGDWGLVFRVTQYNGQANDAQVTIALYNPEFESTRDRPIPVLDGHDVWNVWDTCLETRGKGVPGVERPKVYDHHAYVVDGVLVGTFPEDAVSVIGNTVELSGAFVTAHVVRDELGWRLRDGIIAARWPISSMLGVLSRSTDPLFHERLCTNNPVYPSLKAKICSYADISSSSDDPTAICNALSLAVQIDTVPATLGVVKTSQVDEPCLPEFDPRRDTCDNLE